MSKGLEALENLCDIKIVLNKQMRAGDELQFSLKNSDDYKIIEKALQRLEAIDNAKPSEALEMIEEINVCLETKEDEDNWERQYNTLKNYILKAQEQEKVLDIMNTKWVNMAVLIHSKTVEEYNNNAHTPYNLTQEEFELLKRYCDDDNI